MNRLSATLLAAALATACAPASELPPGGNPTAKGDHGAGGAAAGCGDLGQSFGQAECVACANGACCDELLACDDGTACGALVACETACADAACIASCEADQPEGKAALDDLNACIDGQCADACATPKAGLCGTDLTTQGAACDGCVNASCCPELDACMADAACQGCVRGDPNATGCETNPLLGDVHTCFAGACASSCEG